MSATATKNNNKYVPGNPGANGWSQNPCDSESWSNDAEEYDEEAKFAQNGGLGLLSPCKSGQRPGRPTLVGGGGTTDDEDQSTPLLGLNIEGTSSLSMEGRPNGFRPGADIVSKSTTMSAGDDADTSGAVPLTASEKMGGAAGLSALAASAAVAAFVIAFLVARKRKRNKETSSTGLYAKKHGSADTLTELAGATASANTSFESDLDGDEDDYARTSGSFILNELQVISDDIESGAVAVDLPNMSTPKRKKFLFSEGSPDRSEGGTVDESIEISFLSANSKDIGRRHSAVNVCPCNSHLCRGCGQHAFASMGKVNFVKADALTSEEFMTKISVTTKDSCDNVDV